MKAQAYTLQGTEGPYNHSYYSAYPLSDALEKIIIFPNFHLTRETDGTKEFPKDTSCARHCSIIEFLKNLNKHFISFQPRLIQAAGYPVEKHRATTADGYVLQMHRIPAGRRSARRSNSGGKGKKAVLMVHGLLGSSGDFIIMGPNRSLGEGLKSCHIRFLLDYLFLKAKVGTKIEDSFAAENGRSNSAWWHPGRKNLTHSERVKSTSLNTSSLPYLRLKRGTEIHHKLLLT